MYNWFTVKQEYKIVLLKYETAISILMNRLIKIRI